MHLDTIFVFVNEMFLEFMPSPLHSMVLSSFPLILRLPHSSSVFACVFADRRERETDRAVRDRRNQRKEGRVGKQSEKKRDVAEVCKSP
ncbi:hypothetical protein L1887_01327 [Cichorium endivia]|nr:hypothetical protein L1887_01327 [Cichorium endivia]